MKLPRRAPWKFAASPTTIHSANHDLRSKRSAATERHLDDQRQATPVPEATTPIKATAGGRPASDSATTSGGATIPKQIAAMKLSTRGLERVSEVFIDSG